MACLFKLKSIKTYSGFHQSTYSSTEKLPYFFNVVICYLVRLGFVMLGGFARLVPSAGDNKNSFSLITRKALKSNSKEYDYLL